MQIKPILARLQSALGRNDLIEQMVLLPESTKAKKAKGSKTAKLVVGYNGSPNSQTALDMTLWIAHQTRLATQKQVVVHVVYVVDQNNPAVAQPLPSQFQSYSRLTGSNLQIPVNCLQTASTAARPAERSPRTAVLTPAPALPAQKAGAECVIPDFQPTSSLEHADYVLWQARCLAEEWRGSLEAHLRFGTVSAELRRVVESESADLLLLGCNSRSHPLVRQMTSHFPCPVLGIPHQTHPEEAAYFCQG